MCIALLLMVRNEGRILRRCVESAERLVDAVVVVDTGSTDDTVAVAQELGAVVHKRLWRDFGRSRTESFEAARNAGDLLLALDADMRLVCPDPDALRDYLAAHPAAGYTLVQLNGDLAYRNVRIMRADREWNCRGVTHEYWQRRDAIVEDVPRELCCIDDVNDGGCKEDKFPRDERLLRAGLVEEPGNERYVYYLANTLACEGKRDEAAEMYKRRLAMGGWEQERYMSCYMLAKLSADPVDAEAWAQRATAIDPERLEADMWLAQRLRERRQHHKAWHYLRRRAPPEGKLFLEQSAYDQPRVAYERSILAYYVNEDRAAGMGYCLAALQGPYEAVTLNNLRYYAQPIGGRSCRVGFPAPTGYYAGSVSVNEWGWACVRTANYLIREDNSYEYPGFVHTRNYASTYDFDGGFEGFTELPSPPPHRKSNIRGLEDVRLFGDRFTATQREWSSADRNEVVLGRYPNMLFAVAPSPLGAECEKNWLPAPGGVIYRWHPFQRGEFADGALLLGPGTDTPAWWRHLRGSAPLWRVGRRGSSWPI